MLGEGFEEGLVPREELPNDLRLVEVDAAEDPLVRHDGDREDRPLTMPPTPSLTSATFALLAPVRGGENGAALPDRLLRESASRSRTPGARRASSRSPGRPRVCTAGSGPEDEASVGAGQVQGLGEQPVVEVELLPARVDPEDPGHEVLVVRGRHGPVLGARGGEARLAQVDRRRGPRPRTSFRNRAMSSANTLRLRSSKNRAALSSESPSAICFRMSSAFRVVVRGLRELAWSGHLGERVEELEER